MLRVLLPRHFLSERRYAVHILLGELLGLDYAISVDPDSNAYRLILENGHALEIEDHFFSKFEDGLDYLQVENIPQTVEFLPLPFLSEPDVPLLYGTGLMDIGPGSIRCGLDIFAATFFMLTRWEEAVVTTRDLHGRFPSTASLAGQRGFLHRPLVNEHAEMLWNMLSALGFQQQRCPRRFDWVLTHDVDHPWRWDGPKHLVRTVGGDLFKRHSVSQATKNIASFVDVYMRRRPDPYNTFSELMDLSERVGVKSQFYFMAGGQTPCDPGYHLDDPRLRDILDLIGRRGHEIGFHPSYDTFDKPDLWREEHEAISRVVSTTVLKGRQHFLRFSVPVTWQIWEDNGMEFDSSAGYADAAGFRCGICDAFPVFNVFTRRQLKLQELPLVIMEGSLINYQKLAPEAMQAAMNGLIRTVKRYQGSCVMLWHNSSFHTNHWEPYQHLYSEVLLTP